ncbi:MAG: hypothetical protein MZV63_72405 [Marinilabiliales bacterium]|nr:hypothetical protein [Marinilabiliales bacterium]
MVTADPLEMKAGNPGAMGSPTHDRLPMAFVQHLPRDHRTYQHPYPIGDLPTSAGRQAAPWTSQETTTAHTDDQAEKYNRKKAIRFGIQGGVGRTAFSEGLGISTAKAADLQSGPATGSGSGTPAGVLRLPPGSIHRVDPGCMDDIAHFQAMVLHHRPVLSSIQHPDARLVHGPGIRCSDILMDVRSSIPAPVTSRANGKNTGIDTTSCRFRSSLPGS